MLHVAAWPCDGCSHPCWRSAAAAAATCAGADSPLLTARLHATARRLASPSKPDGGGGGSVRLEAELGEIKGLLAEILRSPSGSRTPGARGARYAASSDASP